MLQLIKNDTITNKISYWHLAAFLVLLPFDFFYSQVILISYTLHTLIHCKQYRLKLLLTRPVLALTAVYFIGIVTILYSPDKKEGLAITGRQTAILLVPVLFVLNELDLSKYSGALLKIFAITCVAVILYLYVDAIRTIRYFGLPVSKLFSNFFINHNFSAPIALHATYLSMYTGLSICTLVFYLMRQQYMWGRIVYIVGIGTLSAGLIQLSSRAAMIAMLIIINIVLPFFIEKKKQRHSFISIAAILSLMGIIFITTIDSFKARYIGGLKNDLIQVSDNYELMEPRIARWELIIPLLKKAPLFGHGNGAEKPLLKQTYFEHKFYISYLNEFNAHNEYLSFLIRAGVVGLLLYCYSLFFGFALAIRKKDFLFLAFMILITIVSISENILDVNKGIFFYSFFLSFFIISNYAGLFYKRQP